MWEKVLEKLLLKLAEEVGENLATRLLAWWDQEYWIDEIVS